MTRQHLASALIITGCLVAAVVAFPLARDQVRYYLDVSRHLLDPTQVSAVRPNLVVRVMGFHTQDLTQAGNWFTVGVPSSAPATASSQIRFFSLSLPRLGLQDIPVAVNGSDLSRSAIHFPATALPGTFGNSVIFGHSSLPGIYKKDHPLAIFNSLPKAKLGDELLVNYDGVTYTYRVTKIHEVQPDNIDVLLQRYDQRQLTLVTCVPLGTYWRRLVVVAQFVDSR